MKEFISNLFKVTNERLKNPLIFSFLLSWLAFNWRPIFTLLLSDKIIEDRISYISENFNEIHLNLFYPLIFSVGYVLLLPYFTWLIEVLVQYAKIGRKRNLISEQLSDLRDKQKIAREEYKYEQEKAGNAEISQLNSNIQELTKVNTEKDKIIERLKIDLTESKKEQKKLEQYISLESPENAEFNEEMKSKLDKEYEEFLSTEVSTYFEEIGSEISQFKSIPNNVDKIVIEKLIYSGLVKKIDDEENQRVYYILTNKGKHFWKNYVLSKRILSKQELERMSEPDDLPF
jgi:DNA-binding HxlR family transcriptional regulator